MPCCGAMGSNPTHNQASNDGADEGIPAAALSPVQVY